MSRKRKALKKPTKKDPVPGKRGNPRKPAAPAPEPYPAWPGQESGIPEHLWDLRAVYRQEKECDRTPAQRVLRTALENKPERFMDMLNKAEEAHALNLRRGLGGEGAEPVDVCFFSKTDTWRMQSGHVGRRFS